MRKSLLQDSGTRRTRRQQIHCGMLRDFNRRMLNVEERRRGQHHGAVTGEHPSLVAEEAVGENQREAAGLPEIEDVVGEQSRVEKLVVGVDGRGAGKSGLAVIGGTLESCGGLRASFTPLGSGWLDLEAYALCGWGGALQDC